MSASDSARYWIRSFHVDYHDGPPVRPDAVALDAFPGTSPARYASAAFETGLLTGVRKARALRFLKKFTLRTRGSGRKPRDAISPVAIPTHDFQRAHSSVDLLRKPDISPLIGFRVEDGPHPMDADDSSQDASASMNSSPLRSRHNSAPIHATFAGRGAAPLFFRDQAGLGNEVLADDSGNVLAPAPLFLRSTLSLDGGPRSVVSSPEISPQINVAPEPRPHEETIHHTLDDDTPRPSGDVTSHNTTFTTLPTDPAPSTSSHPVNLSRPLSAPALEDSASKAAPRRPALLPRHSYSSPLPPPFRLATERGLRLSPSIVARQPMPILNLPALPPPPPAAEDTPPRQNVPLRSIPSLSRHGRSSADCQADHENATLGDSDEDDGDECDEEEGFADALSMQCQSDDEEEEPPSAGPSGIDGFKNSQKQHMTDNESPVQDPSASSAQGNATGPNLADYFCSKTYVNSIRLGSSSTSLAMYPFSPGIPDVAEANKRHTVDPDPPISGVRLERKPSLYRTTSRSMINLGSTRRTERGLYPPRSRETVGSNLGSVSGHTAETQAGSEESGAEADIGRLLRRTSMPSFHPTSDPPPYPTFDPRPRESRVMPPEDEGGERLPTYSNSLYLIAIMPRKMEFSSPGVQAKDRKWRRVVCELEGTAFRVYKCPPGASGAGVLGDWWEKRVGVSDIASPSPPRPRKKEEEVERPVKLGIDEAPAIQSVPSGGSLSAPPARQTRSRTESQSSRATHSTMMTTPRPAKRISGASFLSPFRSASASRSEANGEGSRRPESSELELLPVDMRDSRSSLSNESTGRATPATQRLSQPPQPRSAARLAFLPVATGRAQRRQGDIPKPPKSDLLRAYTLQNAESGLGNDYLKRKNVIRVRSEGEQFLLQAPDIPAVVEWIEVWNVQIWGCGADCVAGAPCWDQYCSGH